MNIQSIYETMEYGPAPESRDAADQWLKSHDHQFQLFIGGEWQAPKTGEYFDSINPADKAVLAKIAKAGEEDVDGSGRYRGPERFAPMGGVGPSWSGTVFVRHCPADSKALPVIRGARIPG
jgi:aldehyde dehydrogenase (NAD+)